MSVSNDRGCGRGKKSASPFPHGKNGRASFVPCQQTRFAIHSHLYLWPCHRFDALFPFPVLRAAFCLAIERKIEGHFNVIANLCEIFLFPAVDPIENLVKSSFLPLSAIAFVHYSVSEL